ncbi:MAG: hypothetical protein JWN75_218 [Candidatus Saccharibacteria bacterium]|nr:hypothetical protein [Candidatus Saccharibacteria bacterium]
MVRPRDKKRLRNDMDLDVVPPCGGTTSRSTCIQVGGINRPAHCDNTSLVAHMRLVALRDGRASRGGFSARRDSDDRVVLYEGGIAPVRCCVQNTQLHPLSPGHCNV